MSGNQESISNIVEFGETQQADDTGGVDPSDLPDADTPTVGQQLDQEPDPDPAPPEVVPAPDPSPDPAPEPDPDPAPADTLTRGEQADQAPDPDPAPPEVVGPTPDPQPAAPRPEPDPTPTGTVPFEEFQQERQQRQQERQDLGVTEPQQEQLRERAAGQASALFGTEIQPSQVELTEAEGDRFGIGVTEQDLTQDQLTDIRRAQMSGAEVDFSQTPTDEPIGDVPTPMDQRPPGELSDEQIVSGLISEQDIGQATEAALDERGEQIAAQQPDRPEPGTIFGGIEQTAGAIGAGVTEGVQQIGTETAETVAQETETATEVTAPALGGVPTEPLTGPPGTIESFAGDVAFGVRDASAGAAEAVQQEVVQPGAGLFGELVEGTPTLPSTLPTPVQSAATAEQRAGAEGADFGLQPDTAFGLGAEQFATGAGREATQMTVGLPAEAVEIGAVGADALEFTGRQIESQGVVGGLETSGQAAAAVGETAARQMVEQAQENPALFAGQIFGGFATGVAASPFRVSRVDVPTARRGEVEIDPETQSNLTGADVPGTTREILEPTGETTVRGLRVDAPPIARAFGVRTRGRTIAGTRGGRPTLGAPSLEPIGTEIDLRGLGTTGTATAEAQSAFEADIFRTTAGDVSPEVGERFEAAEAVQRQGQVTQQPGFTAETAEGAIGAARAVPEGAEPDVAEALRDVEATVFGSAAARAQLGDFREPRDIDITIPEARQAPKTAPISEQFPETAPRLEESLEGFGATAQDVFDIKPTEAVPGRAAGGEPIKFGRISQEPQELGGIPFNPVTEELVRKSGASAFLREPGAAGTPDLDVGPEPRRPGRVDVRRKDVEDTQMIARELGILPGTTRRFEEAFGLESPTPEVDQGSVFDVGLPGGFRDLAADTRGQAGVGGGLFGSDIETDTTGTLFGTTRRADTPEQRGPSPGGRTSTGTGQPSPFGAVAAGDTTLFGGPTPSVDGPGSPGGRRDADGGTVGGLFGGPSPGDATQQDTGLPTPPGGPGGPTQQDGGGTIFFPSPPGEPGDEPDSPGGGGITFWPGPSPPTGGGGEPLSPFPPETGIPGFGPTDEPQQRFRGDDDSTDREEFRLFETDPTGQEFENPVASGAAFFGIGTGGQQDFSAALTPNEQERDRTSAVELFTGQQGGGFF